jgi:hypothetical protein
MFSLTYKKNQLTNTIIIGLNAFFPEKTSSLGVAIRTPNDIKEKWNNLKKEAKTSAYWGSPKVNFQNK